MLKEVLAKEEISIEPVLKDCGNIDIFEECKYDVEIFLEKYPQSRNLSKNEIITLYSLCEVGKKYQFADDIILGSGESLGYECLFKIEDGRWIVWETDERRGFLNSAKVFDSAIEACHYLIFLLKGINNENECKDYFNNLLTKDISNEELIDFSKDFNYLITESRRRKKK